MSLGSCQRRGTPPRLSDTTICVASKPRNPWLMEQRPFPTSSPRQRAEHRPPGWSQTGSLPSMAPLGNRPVCYHRGLNHGIAATLSTHRRDLATPRAINRAVLVSPCRAGRVRESKANSKGGKALSLPKERSSEWGNNLPESRNRSGALSPLIASRPHAGSAEPRGNNEQRSQRCGAGRHATTAPFPAPRNPGGFHSPWGNHAMGWSIVAAVLPAWPLTSPVRCESHPDRPAARAARSLRGHPHQPAWGQSRAPQTWV